jgi:hypothetical protein
MMFVSLVVRLNVCRPAIQDSSRMIDLCTPPVGGIEISPHFTEKVCVTWLFQDADVYTQGDTLLRVIRWSLSNAEASRKVPEATPDLT